MSKFYKNLAIALFGLSGICAIPTNIIQNNLNNNDLKNDLIKKDNNIATLTYERHKLLDEGLEKSQKNYNLVKSLIEEKKSVISDNNELQFEIADLKKYNENMREYFNNLRNNHEYLTEEYNTLSQEFVKTLTDNFKLINEISQSELEKDYYKKMNNHLDSVLRNCPCYYEGISVPENFAFK